jgi:hypothetical protein
MTKEELEAKVLADKAIEDKANEAEKNSVKTFTQEDINKIVVERLAREKEKYSDYETLKQKATKLDELDLANKSELEKEQAKSAKFEKLLAEKEKEKQLLLIENLKLSLLETAGLPKSWSKRISGTTEDEIKADIEELKKVLGDKAANIGQSIGGKPSGTPDTENMTLAEYEAWRYPNKK